MSNDVLLKTFGSDIYAAEFDTTWQKKEKIGVGYIQRDETDGYENNGVYTLEQRSYRLETDVYDLQKGQHIYYESLVLCVMKRHQGDSPIIAYKDKDLGGSRTYTVNEVWRENEDEQIRVV